MNAFFDNCSLIINIIIQKDRQEESSIKERKKKTQTHNKLNHILLMGFKIKSISKQAKSK
jgi:hypothetical protein